MSDTSWYRDGVAPEWGQGAFLLLANGKIRELGAVEDVLAVDDEGGALVVVVGEVVHHVEHQLVHDRPQRTGAGLTLQGALGDLLECALGEFQLRALDPEEVLELVDQCVLGFGQDPDHRGDVERHQRADDRETSDQLWDESEFKHVVGGDLREQLAGLVGAAGLDCLGRETDPAAADPPSDDLLDADERTTADEQDVGRVHLDVLLFRVLPAALGRHVGDRALEHLEGACCTPSPETSRVIDTFWEVFAILSISSM